MDILERYNTLKERIDQCQKHAPLAQKQVKMVAVSKGHGIADMMPLLAAGQRIFGENRVQEAQEKWGAVRASYPDLELHLIGSLQSNKVKEALALFDVIQTLDRPSLIDAIAREIKRTTVQCTSFFIQVNTGEEVQKGGVHPYNLQSLYDHAQASHLPVTGLMCVPPTDSPPAPHFAFLRKKAKELDLQNVSMGMSSDFETAIRLGASHVRIGTALFGERT